MYQEVLKVALIGTELDFDRRIKQLGPSGPVSQEAYRCGIDGIKEGTDAVFIDIRNDADTGAVDRLVEAVPDSVQIIVLADPSQAHDLAPLFDRLTDVWTGDIGPDLIDLRLKRWQQSRVRRLQLWETDQYLETTINSIPSLVWYKSADGIHHKVNDSFCNTVKKTKDDVQGKGHAYIWNVEHDDPACIESEEKVMTSRQTLVSEEIIDTGEGERILTTYKSPLYTPKGDVMGTVGIGIDITRERAFEQELLDRNRTLEAIITSMDAGVLTHSMDGTELYSVNRAALDMLGLDSEEEVIGKGFSMVAPTVIDEDKERLRNAIMSIHRPGETASIEYRVQHRDGKIVHILGNIKVVERNGLLYYQRFLLDISDRIAEEERNKERQRSLIQALSDDFVLAMSFNLDTMQGELLRISNSRKARLDGLFGDSVDYDDFLHSYVDHFVVEEDRDSMYDSLNTERLIEILADQRAFHEMYRAVHTEGPEYCEVAVVRTPMWPEEHEVVMGFRSVDSQIRKEIEQRQTLEEALRAANKASESKSAFLQNMSHDIRTPMNAIVGFSTLARNHIDEKDSVLDYLNKIQNSSSHLVSLINDILDMSRIESGKATISEQACNLKDLLMSVHELLSPQAEAAHINFVLDMEGLSHPEVMCDRMRLNQILLNLLGNALKFTPEHGTISLRAKELVAENSGETKYSFVVEDTGIGMSQEFVKHIFEPFEREQVSTISKLEGSGLGMAITKGLVDMMYGTIMVESEKDKGTKMTIVLPLEQVVRESTDIPQIIEETGSRRADYYKGHILLVDDNALNREIARTLLEDEGFMVETAENGEDALNTVQHFDSDYFSIILMDIQMPVMNGYEAAKKIRELPDERISQLPIFAVTADAFDEDKQKALAAGMNGHLSKPIDVDELLETLDQVFANK